MDTKRGQRFLAPEIRLRYEPVGQFTRPIGVIGKRAVE
jgi:hypothetical protein